DEDEPNADDEELPKPKPLKELIVVGMEVEFFVPNDTEPRIGIVKRVDAMEGMAPSALVREDGKPKSTRVPIVLGRITPLPKDEDAAPDGEPATEVGSVGKLI
ncbi:MAG: hypothetical protein OES13_00195, partial [Acidimicrobiia bacterium]|nr:hypothetical protein [Acidimicrobiia bacterium]